MAYPTASAAVKSAPNQTQPSGSTPSTSNHTPSPFGEHQLYPARNLLIDLRYYKLHEKEAVPCQYIGTIDGIWFYFRYAWEKWRLEIFDWEEFPQEEERTQGFTMLYTGEYALDDDNNSSNDLPQYVFFNIMQVYGTHYLNNRDAQQVWDAPRTLDHIQRYMGNKDSDIIKRVIEAYCGGSQVKKEHRPWY